MVPLPLPPALPFGPKKNKSLAGGTFLPNRVGKNYAPVTSLGHEGLLFFPLKERKSGLFGRDFVLG